jgi:hypothetical protein
MKGFTGLVLWHKLNPHLYERLAPNRIAWV